MRAKGSKKRPILSSWSWLLKQFVRVSKSENLNLTNLSRYNFTTTVFLRHNDPLIWRQISCVHGKSFIIFFPFIVTGPVDFGTFVALVTALDDDVIPDDHHLADWRCFRMIMIAHFAFLQLSKITWKTVVVKTSLCCKLLLQCKASWFY